MISNIQIYEKRAPNKTSCSNGQYIKISPRGTTVNIGTELWDYLRSEYTHVTLGFSSDPRAIILIPNAHGQGFCLHRVSPSFGVIMYLKQFNIAERGPFSVKREVSKIHGEIFVAYLGDSNDKTTKNN